MNTHRLTAVDFVRGFSVLIMVCVHTLWMYGSRPRGNVTGEIIHLLGKGTAAFLIAMGISLLLSRHHSPRALATGRNYTALGYGMNALKFVLPIAPGYYLTLSMRMAGNRRYNSRTTCTCYTGDIPNGWARYCC